MCSSLLLYLRGEYNVLLLPGRGVDSNRLGILDDESRVDGLVALLFVQIAIAVFFAVVMAMVMVIVMIIIIIIIFKVAKDEGYTESSTK